MHLGTEHIKKGSIFAPNLVLDVPVWTQVNGRFIQQPGITHGLMPEVATVTGRPLIIMYR